MRRLEFSDGKSNKFWEIALDGRSYVVRYGRMGTDGQTNTKVFDSEEKAEKALEKALQSKLKKGYIEVVAKAAKVGGNPELEAALLENPDDREAWRVYADWLLGEGDPRGELVLAQLKLAELVPERPAGAPRKRRRVAMRRRGPAAAPPPEDPAVKAVREQIETLIAANRKAWLPDFDMDEVEDCLHIEWGFGFWDRVKLQVDYDNWDFELVKVLGMVLRHPSSKFLRRLEIGLADTDGENDYTEVIKSIVKHGSRPSLRELHIGAFEFPDETEISWTHVGSVNDLWAVLPGLEQLALTGGGIELGKIDAPSLKRLELETGGLPSAAARSLAKASMPALERLQVWFGTEDYGGSCTIDDVQAVLDNVSGFPELRWLGLMNSEHQDAIAAAVVKAPLVKQLDTLSLSMGTMGAAGADVLIAGADALRHLSVLDVTDNCMADEVVERLKQTFPDIEADDQRYDDDWVYVSVGE